MALSSLQLEAFYAVARAKSFTIAAENLHVSQSALSQRILNLEQELETTLFLRERSGLQLTEVAIELLQYCQTKDHLESEFLERLKSRSSKELAGVIRIAGFSSVMRSVVLPSLANLIREYPKVQLHFLTRELSELPSLLRKGEADVIISSEELQSDDYETVLLGHEINVLVESKSYEGSDVFLDHDDRDETTLAYLKLRAGDRASTPPKFAKPKPAKPRRHFLDDVYGLLDGVELGLGRAVLPRHLINTYFQNASAFRIIDPQVTLTSPVNLYHYRQPFYSRLHHAALTAIIEGAGQSLNVD